MDEQTKTEKVKGVVDIVFLIDVTGSMQHCIDALKANISGFIDGLTTKSANNESPVKHWRGKVVGFRDYEHDKVPFVDQPFVEDAGLLRDQLNALTAEGGGDEPESLLDALYKVATMASAEKADTTVDPLKWRYRYQAARVVVVFTDASCHPKMTEPKGGTVDEVVNAIHENRIILSLFAPEMDCYNKLSAADKAEWTAFAFDATSDGGAAKALADLTSDPAKFKKTMEMLAKSVSASVGTPLL
jgi:uncharacterized protein YegL